jgi:hypothetical protein
MEAELPIRQFEKSGRTQRPLWMYEVVDDAYRAN